MKSDDSERLSSVGKTALGMAMVRASEDDQPAPLFHDPFARYFVEEFPDAFGPEEEVTPEQARVGAIFFSLGSLRTRFFDDYLLAATEGGIRQVVLLGVGLDTRAFRLAWPPGTSVFELDRSDVFTFKDAVLSSGGAEARCHKRVTVVADLQQDDWPDALVRSGFDRSSPAAFLMEGLMTYLLADDAKDLLSSVSQLAAPSSRLAMEDEEPARELLDSARSIRDMDEFTALWKGGLGAALLSWLEQHGWSVRPTTFVEAAADYSRELPREAIGRYLMARRLA
jgi:methyltransferase (TIGR00027 family)